VNCGIAQAFSTSTIQWYPRKIPTGNSLSTGAKVEKYEIKYHKRPHKWKKTRSILDDPPSLEPFDTVDRRNSHVLFESECPEAETCRTLLSIAPSPIFNSSHAAHHWPGKLSVLSGVRHCAVQSKGKRCASLADEASWRLRHINFVGF
jgi:hypothetical protein